MTTVYKWRGAFTNQEINALHAEAFHTRLFDESQWNWVELVQGAHPRFVDGAAQRASRA